MMMIFISKSFLLKTYCYIWKLIFIMTDFSSFSSKKINDEISVYSLTNENGIEAQFTNFGATILSLIIPTKNGKIDVLLGFDNVEEYIKAFEIGASPYFNCVVGRFAGRIKNAQFYLNNQLVLLDKNHGKHHLHGGNHHLSNVAWDFINYDEKNNSIAFSYLSKANDFYSGDVSVEVNYSLSKDNKLIINYKATSTEDTLFNLTNHAYFNLDGFAGSVLDQKMMINAEQFLELDEENIPTGKYILMENHQFDYRNFKNVVSGIDHCFIIKNETQPAAILMSEKNHLKMKVYTNQPAVQIYVGGKTVDELKNKENTTFHSESGICFETQVFPDAPNHENFPNAILRQGETYLQNTSFEFEF